MIWALPSKRPGPNRTLAARIRRFLPFPDDRPALADWLAGLLLLAICLAFTGYVAIFLRHAQVLIDYPYDVDQGEAYDVWTAWRLWRGEPIYTSNAQWPYFSTNYPPFFFILLGPLLHWFGLGMGVGRALGATATLLCGVAVFVAARQYSRDSLAAILAALLFAGSTYVFHVGALARVNTLAALLALVGVLLAGQPGRWRLPLGLGFVLLAVFTKQTALDALASVLLFLLARNARKAFVASVVSLTCGLVGVAILEWWSGGSFLLNAVAGNANPWDGWQALAYMLNFLSVHRIVGVFAVAGLWLSRRSLVSVYPFYLVVAAVASLSVGKWGAGESYFLPMLLACCVVAAPALSCAVRHPLIGVRLLTCLLLAWQLVLYAHGPTLKRLTGLEDGGFQAHALGKQPTYIDRAGGDLLVQHYVRRWSGPILAEEAGVVVAGGKEVVGNATHLRNLDEAGLLLSHNLVLDVQARRFDFVILRGHLYPRPLLAAIGDSYYLYAEVPMDGYNYQVFAPGAN